MKRPVVDEKGMTLVEVVVAITILVVGLVPIFAAMANGYINLKQGQDIDRAMLLLQGMAEELKLSPFASPTLAEGEEVVPNYKGHGYDLTKNIIDRDDYLGADGQPAMKEVHLVMKKESRSVGKLDFLIYKEGI